MSATTAASRWLHRRPDPALTIADQAAQIRALGITLAQQTAHIRALEHAATHDPLTGLLNRSGLAGEYERSQPRVVLLIDLDGFKAVNDTHGHAAGDEVLKTIAARLTGIAGARVARLSGDEMVVLTDDADGTTADLERLVNMAVPVPGASVRVGVSVGVTHVAPGDTLTVALGRADRAMYAAKRCGGGSCTWTPALGGLPTRRVRDAQELAGGSQ